MMTSRAKQERAEALACLDLAEDFSAECIVAGNLEWYDLAIAEADALRDELVGMEEGK